MKRDSLVMERIQSNLNRLRLARSSAILSDLVKTAEAGSLSYPAFLDELLEEEVAHKEQRRLETALRISGLPFIKTIDEFDFAFQPHLDRRQIMALFDLTFIQEQSNILFLGPPGVGKTHLAVALMVKACQAGFSVYSTNMGELIVKLKKDHERGRSARGRSYYKSTVVMVDEVGYTPISRDECNLFYRFIATRYEKNSTIITSNKSFADWTELFHDPIIISAILDRLLHHSTVINIKGDSYRLKGKPISLSDSLTESAGK